MKVRTHPSLFRIILRLPGTKSLFSSLLAGLLLCGSPGIKAQAHFGAAAAFSLRKLFPSYTGNAIQVRRSSDNLTKNIGFTACGHLDTAALKTFAGAASAYVAIWYDQSGNSRNATQATTASQPRIINAGAIDHANGRPTIVWPGASNSGIYLSYGSSFNIQTVNAVRDFKLNPFTASANNMQYLFSSPANTDFSIRLSSSGVFSYDGDNNSNDWINGSGTPKLCWVNGAQTTTPQYGLHNLTAIADNAVNGSFSIGTTFLDRNLFGNDAVSELVVFPDEISDTQRTLIETNQAAYYNITIGSSQYSPPSSSSYNLYVSGIGRESNSDTVAAVRSSVGMGFLVSGGGSFLKNNGDYITAGINCPISPSVSTANLPATIVQRWQNDWYVQKTDVSNNNGTLSFYFDFSDYGVGTPGTASNYELLYRSSATANFTIVTGTTKTKSGDRMLFSINASNIISNRYYTIGTKNTSASPLPIELSSFQCSAGEAGAVALNWTTASESGNAYFSVERSQDGMHYQELGKVKGAGTSITGRSYTFNDLQALPGIVYYRLRQVDEDGSSKIFNPCSVNRDAAPGIIIAPNPADDVIEISAAGSASDKTVSVLYASGQVVLQAVFQDKIKIFTAALASGFYLVKIQDGDLVTIKKLIIRH